MTPIHDPNPYGILHTGRNWYAVTYHGAPIMRRLTHGNAAYIARTKNHNHFVRQQARAIHTDTRKAG